MSAPSAGRWAALHAASLPPGRGQSPAAVRDKADFDLGPAVVASCTELHSWNVGDRNYAVALAQRGDGVVLATGGRDQDARLWDPLTGALERELGGHRVIWAAKFGRGPDGALLLATGGTDNTAQIWDAETGRALHVLSGHHGTVAGVAWGYHPDGQPFLVTAAQDGTGRIWDPVSGAHLHTLPLQPDAWNAAVGYRPDRRAVVAIAGDSGSIAIWEPVTGQLEASFTDGRLIVTSVAVGSRPGREPLLATASRGGARIWTEWLDRGRGERSSIELTPGTGDPAAMAWAPLDDGRALLATTTAEALLLWDGATGQRLHTERGQFAAGFNHLDWAFAPGGELLLAATTADGRAHLWEVRLEPPAQPGPRSAPAAGSRARAAAREPRPATILRPPEEVTPHFTPAAGTRLSMERLSNVEQHGSQTLVAGVTATRVRGDGGEVQVWDLTAGALAHVFRIDDHAQGAAIGTAAGRAPRLIAGSNDRVTRIWDLGTGELLQTLGEHSDEVVSVAWRDRPDGPTLLATGGGDGTARIWDPDAGQLLRTISGLPSSIHAVAWGRSADGRLRLAIGWGDGSVQIRDPDTGGLLRTLAAHRGSVWSVAWRPGPDGQPPLLATGGSDNAVRIWNADSGARVRDLTRHTGWVFSTAWADLGDGRWLLASASADGTARIWNPDTGDELASVPSDSPNRQAIALHTSPDGDLRLVVASHDQGSDPVRVWRLATGVTPSPPPTAASGPQLAPQQAARLAGWLLRLGGGGLWPPLGLLAGLVELTGPSPAARDSGLTGLAGEPGIARLRALGWEPDARVAFAAVIASGLTVPDRYAPPADAPPATLREELARALTRPGDGAEPNVTPAGEVRAAAGLISEATVALLAILGPAACAADPLLPVRLAHRGARLPTLTPRELRLISAVGRRREAASQAAATGTMVYSPGTAGLARTGPLTRLLPAQLALPRGLLTMRMAENELLYREHRAPAPPAPEPVTIILDVTPPTFGPAGSALRLAVHLMTAALWEHDRYPYLVTLGAPAVMTELRHPADLLGIWAGSTLDEPAAALATALATATEIGQPVVFASHFLTARDCRYQPGRGTRLLTAHHPPERPPAPPTEGWHRHLPPGPTEAQLMTTIGRLLGGGTADGN